MSGGASLFTGTKFPIETADSEIHEDQCAGNAAKILNFAINKHENTVFRADTAPTICLPVMHYSTQAELFPRPAASDDEREFCSILEKIMPDNAPLIVSVINRMERGEDSFLVEGLMCDGTVVNLELVGRYIRGGKARLRWYAHPNEVQFGWESGSKR